MRFTVFNKNQDDNPEKPEQSGENGQSDNPDAGQEDTPKKQRGGWKKTMTPAAMRANKENAQKAKGKPRDTSRSRYNAWWHGCRSSRIVAPWENMEEYKKLAKSLFEEFGAQGTYEHWVITTMADRIWEHQRLKMLKTNSLVNAEYRDQMFKDFETLEMYQYRVERAIFKLRGHLDKVQTKRFKEEAKMLARGEELKDVPCFETEIYTGPLAKHRPTEGEAAVYELTKQAKRKMRHQAEKDGKYYDNAIHKRADTEMMLGYDDLDQMQDEMDVRRSWEDVSDNYPYTDDDPSDAPPNKGSG